MGDRAREDRRAAGGGRVHHLHPGVDRGRAAEHRGRPGPAHRHRRRRARRRDGGRRDRGLRVRPAHDGRHRRRPAGGTRAHPAVQPDRPRLGVGSRPRPAHARHPGAGPPAPQAGRLRAGGVLPGQGPHQAGHDPQRPAGLAVVRRLGRGAGPGPRPPPAVGRRGPAGVRRRHARPPVGRGAPVRGVVAARPARHLDAAPAGDRPPARARLLRRGPGVRAAHRRSTGQEADPHAVQAGSGVRRGAGARHPEPRGRRLQGPGQRRHLDHRAAADRAGQGPVAGRPVVGRRGRGRGRRGRHDRRAGQAGVHAARARGRRPLAVHHPLGHVVPAGARSPASRSPR